MNVVTTSIRALMVTALITAGCGGLGSKSNSILKLHGDEVDHAQLVERNQPKTPFHTVSRYIVDAEGTRFKLAAVNWYGASDQLNVVGGLDKATLATIVKNISAMGFNAIRLPFSNMMLHNNDAVSRSAVAANPDLFDKKPLEVFDAVVKALTDEGLVVILNNHTTHPMWCCNYDDDGLWYTNDYSEDAWVQDWIDMATRYRDNSLVAGADLRNEIRIAKWNGTILPAFPNWAKSPNDWHAAAERAGNAVQAANPDMLIIVEGLNAPRYQLRGVYNDPIRMTIPYKVVYAVHNYSFTKPELTKGPSYGEMNWDDYQRKMDDEWGYVLTPHQAYTAPVWLSEFGLGKNDHPDGWFNNVIRYLREKDADYAVWALNIGPKANGENEDFGYLSDDWQSPLSDFRVSALQSIMKPQSGPGIEGDWYQRPENHLEILPFSDWNVDHRANQYDWAAYSIKASCHEGARVTGMSQGMRSNQRYNHAALCSDYGYEVNGHDDITLGDNGGDSQWSGQHTGNDWDGGANKLECPKGYSIVGLAQQHDGIPYKLTAVLCRSGLDAGRSGSCNVVWLNGNDVRRSQTGSDWDTQHSKAQCGDLEYAAAISLHKGYPSGLLCCAMQ